MRKALYGVGIAVLAAAACLALITVLASRDSAEVDQAASGPGTLEALVTSAPSPAPVDRPPTSGPHQDEPIDADRSELSDDQILTALALGNVVLVYDDEPPADVQEEVSGPFDPELAAAGQAVILARRPGVGPIQGLAWRRRVVASGPDDPVLQEFADAWLGLGESAEG